MTSRVIIADDHSIVRSGVKSLLEADGGYSVIAELRDVIELKALADKTKPDIIILDYLMPGDDTFSIALEIKRISRDTKILIYTGLDSSMILSKLCRSDIDGILLKQDAISELLKALRIIKTGIRYISPRTREYTAYTDVQLTAREVQILRMILLGFSRSKIAEKLDVSPETIKSHRKNLMRKLEVQNVAELIQRSKDFQLKDGITG